MENHEMHPELTEIADTIVGDYAKQLQEKHPDITYGAASGVARLDLGLAVAFPSGDPAQIKRIQAIVFGHLVEKGVDWAVNYHTVVTESLYRPAYDSAIEADVDPAMVIAANCKIPLKEARAIARGFKKEDAAKPSEAGPDTAPEAPVADSPFDVQNADA